MTTQTAACEEASTNVIEAIATATDTAPTALGTPLYDAVDPDALDALMRSDGDIEVQFEYAGHEIVVRGADRIAVDGVEIRPEGA